MAAYYNEIDPYTAQWLRNLIAAGHIAPGEVDERSIEDVRPGDLRKFEQCHFFAGIGVWSHALRRAGWPDDRPVWTGSCPCQPFSAAGKGLGFSDERHLWPAWYWLISECRPPVIFGEQVASSAVEPWIDLVHADMEALDYPFGCAPFPAAGVGSPNIRDRAYWMAYADRGMGHPVGATSKWFAGSVSRSEAQVDRARSVNGRVPVGPEHAGASLSVRMEDTDLPVAEQPAGEWAGSREASGARTHHQSDGRGELAEGQLVAGPTNGFWRAADWLLCRDGKWRPVEPGTFPLVDGAPSRVGRLRAYGNAINAEAATQFIEVAMECLP